MEMIFAALLGVVAVHAPEVANPSFEALNEQNNLPAGWWYTSLPNLGHLVRYESVALDKNEQTRALAITVVQGHPEKTVCYNAHQILPNILPGKTYRVSAKVRTKGLTQLPVVALQCLDTTKTKYFAISVSPEQTLTSDIDNWETIETQLTIPAETEIVWLRIGLSSTGNTGGTALLDDVQVIEVPTPITH